jgi:branched-chain amino acid transport system permease protein
MRIQTLSRPADARLAPAAQRHWRGLAATLALLVLAVLPLLTAERFIITVAVTVFIAAIAACSLHLIIRIGHVSLGHAAFMGVGAYVSAYATMKLGLPFPLALAAAFAAPAALALLIGPLVLRLTGKYFVLVTFLFGEIIRLIFVEWISVTGGSNGIFGVPAPAPLFVDPAAYYFLALGFSVVIIGFIARLLNSEFGRAMDAIRESERLARCSGVPVLKIKVTVFALGCGIVGIAGALQGHFVRYIDPTSFSTIQSLNLVVMNVIGGMHTLIGPIIGTLFLTVLPEFLRSYVELQRVFFGIIIIIVMAFFPGGIVEIGARGLARLRQRANARAS